MWRIGASEACIEMMSTRLWSATACFACGSPLAVPFGPWKFVLMSLWPIHHGPGYKYYSWVGCMTRGWTIRHQNLFAEAVSPIPGIVDKYLANQMNEAVKAAVQLQIEKSVNEQLEAEVLIRSSNKAKISYAIAANLSELELKKILIDKMENNKLVDRSVQQKTLYKTLVDAYETNKTSLQHMAILSLLKDVEVMRMKMMNPPLDQTGGQKEGKLEKNLSLLVLHRTRRLNLEEPAHQEFETGFTKDHPVDETSQLPDWFQKPAKPPTLDLDWNMTLPANHGPIQPWISTLAQNEDPRGSFNELMDIPLDFSTFMLNRLKVDTLTPELLAGPTFELMKGSCKSLVELEYFLKDVYKATTDQLDWNNPEGHGGVSSRTYATSVMKTKAADYGHIKWIEYLVSNTMWRNPLMMSTPEKRIIAIKQLKIVKWNNYKYLDWITVRRDDDKLYTFKKGDYNRLRLQDIKDILLLLVQGKLANLNIEECLALSVSLRMFTRSIVIKRRVEDLQLGVKSYQKKLNLTKQDTDGTLNDVQSALNDILKRIRMEYLPQTFWRNVDRERAGAMIQAIDQQLKSRRIMRSLEKFVGGRSYVGDLQLLERII
ncbi:hypothetical protein Tco_0238230 [Tanacetum coccineum]